MSSAPTRPTGPSLEAAGPAWTVAVRALCGFAARTGDLDLRFTPAPDAREGIEGHRVVASRRGPGHRAEVPVEVTWGPLRVRGRVDGWDAAAGRVEEVKTHRGPVDRIPPHHRALHRAQAMAYAWMLCRLEPRAGVEVAVVYYDVDRGTETVLAEWQDAEALRAAFEAMCARYLDWAEQEHAHRTARDAWLAGLRWPFDGFRDGQRTLATAVYRAARSGRTLLAQAPTGIGKTMATLYPMLKAAATQGLDKVFYLTARGSGRALALDALARLARTSVTRPAPLRVLALVAREHACEHPDKACHGASCPLARGFFDRLPAARAQAVAGAMHDPAALRSVALAHAVCPYHLSHELARWADVIVADVHLGYDGSALLPALAAEGGWRTGWLVDEAHNLADRAREMFSATITLDGVRAARAEAPRGLGAAVDRVRRAAAAIATEVAATPDGFRAVDTVPVAWLDALRGFTSSVGQRLADDPLAVRGATLQLHFDALRFLALAETLDLHGQFDVTARAPRRRAAADASLVLRTVVPAPFLRPRHALASTTVLFSATLAPPAHHRLMLGLPDDTAELDVPSPFDAGQLDVRIVRDVSTRWADRAASVEPLARLARAAFRTRPGNHLVFLSSFDYLDAVADALARLDPGIPQRRQRRRMTTEERDAFVASFEPGGAQVGFAVLGGVFGEGIDLPGSRLVGAVVATLGLPQVNPVTASVRRRLHALPPPAGGDGWTHACLVPGIRRVVQAAGRVIRTPEDRGSLLLVDDRFTRPEVRALLPAWWRPRVVRAADVTGA